MIGELMGSALMLYALDATHDNSLERQALLVIGAIIAMFSLERRHRKNAA